MYGPVLFVLSVKVVEARSAGGGAWITKVNPIYWDQIDDSQRWFQAREELDAYFDTWEFCHQLVFRGCAGVLPLKGFLKRIVLDDPQGDAYFQTAERVLKAAMKEGGLHVPIERHNCRDRCSCLREYGRNPHLTRERFDPNPQPGWQGGSSDPPVAAE